MPKVLLPTAGGAGRFARGRRISTTLAEINVIPLVDVMLVLLIIFMVTAPMLQRGVEVRLPVSRESREIASERLFVDVPESFRRDRRVFLGAEAVRVEVLAERVRQLLVNRTDKHVFLRTDGRLSVQDMIDVLSSLRSGGVVDAGIVTEVPPRR
jgi:biopolymer transport protein ExbD/biopolymer transport protein TolR